MLQIEHLLDRKPAQLSGGQRQRVAMGRALARDPKLFLFDEPLSNLDAKLRVEMRAEIKLLHQRTRTTTVYVTHDQVEAMTLGDRIAVMKGGRIEQFGTPDEIYGRPATRFVAEFIGSPAMNFIAVDRREGALCSASVVLAMTEAQRVAVDASRADKLLYGIRPESLSLSGHGLPGSVRMVEPTGPDTYMLIDTPSWACSPRACPARCTQAVPARTCWCHWPAAAIAPVRREDRAPRRLTAQRSEYATAAFMPDRGSISDISGFSGAVAQRHPGGIGEEARQVLRVLRLAVAVLQAAEDAQHLQVPLQPHPFEGAPELAEVVAEVLAQRHAGASRLLPPAHGPVELALLVPADEGVAQHRRQVVGDRAAPRPGSRGCRGWGRTPSGCAASSRGARPPAAAPARCRSASGRSGPRSAAEQRSR
jgi:hypothetical protein